MVTLFDLLGLTHKKAVLDFANLIGISPAELRYYNDLKKIPSRALVNKIAKAANISPDFLRFRLGDYDPELLEKFFLKDKNTTADSPEHAAIETSPMEHVFKTSLGNLYEGDCLDVMKLIPDGSVDLVFADPPFNLSKDYPSGINDSLKDEDYLSWCKEWIEESIRILKFGGSLFLWNIPKWHVALVGYLEKKLSFRHWISVDIKYSLPIAGRLYPSHYSLLYYTKGEKPNTFHPDRVPMQVCKHCFHEIKDYGGYKGKMNPKGVNLADIWTDIPPVRHSKYKKRQTANELSVKLLDRIIEMSTNEGDLVFDPFGGSGTTYVVAELKKRHWIGVDIGDTQCIVSRFLHINDDAANLSAIRDKTNCLFTHDVERKREELHIWTPATLGKTPQKKDPFEDMDSLF